MNWNSETKTTPHSDTNTEKKKEKEILKRKRRQNNQFRPYICCLCIICCVWIYFLLVLDAHWLLHYRLPYIYRCVVVSCIHLYDRCCTTFHCCCNFFIHLQTVWLWVAKKQKQKYFYIIKWKRTIDIFPNNIFNVRMLHFARFFKSFHFISDMAIATILCSFFLFSETCKNKNIKKELSSVFPFML